MGQSLAIFLALTNSKSLRLTIGGIPGCTSLEPLGGDGSSWVVVGVGGGWDGGVSSSLTSRILTASTDRPYLPYHGVKTWGQGCKQAFRALETLGAIEERRKGKRENGGQEKGERGRSGGQRRANIGWVRYDMRDWREERPNNELLAMPPLLHVSGEWLGCIQ